MSTDQIPTRLANDVVEAAQSIDAMLSVVDSVPNPPRTIHEVAADLDRQIADLPTWVQNIFKMRLAAAKLIEFEASLKIIKG